MSGIHSGSAPRRLPPKVEWSIRQHMIADGARKGNAQDLELLKENHPSIYQKYELLVARAEGLLLLSDNLWTTTAEANLKESVVSLPPPNDGVWIRRGKAYRSENGQILECRAAELEPLYQEFMNEVWRLKGDVRNALRQVGSAFLRADPDLGVTKARPSSTSETRSSVATLVPGGTTFFAPDHAVHVLLEHDGLYARMGSRNAPGVGTRYDPDWYALSFEPSPTLDAPELPFPKRLTPISDLGQTWRGYVCAEHVNVDAAGRAYVWDNASVSPISKLLIDGTHEPFEFPIYAEFNEGKLTLTTTGAGFGSRVPGENDISEFRSSRLHPVTSLELNGHPVPTLDGVARIPEAHIIREVIPTESNQPRDEHEAFSLVVTLEALGWSRGVGLGGVYESLSTYATQLERLGNTFSRSIWRELGNILAQKGVREPHRDLRRAREEGRTEDVVKIQAGIDQFGRLAMEALHRALQGDGRPLSKKEENSELYPGSKHFIREVRAIMSTVANYMTEPIHPIEGPSNLPPNDIARLFN